MFTEQICSTLTIGLNFLELLCLMRVVIKYSHQKRCISCTCTYLLIHFTHSTGFNIKTWEILSVQNIILKFPVTATCFSSNSTQNSSDMMISHNPSQHITEQQLKISKKYCPLIFPAHH